MLESPQKQGLVRGTFPFLLFEEQNVFLFILIQELMQSHNEKQRWNLCRSGHFKGTRPLLDLREPAPADGGLALGGPGPASPSPGHCAACPKGRGAPGPLRVLCQGKVCEEYSPATASVLLREKELGQFGPPFYFHGSVN